ncbi:polysaccharide deacetylase family protein [Halorubrum ezzemoulense]|uniref:Polysaccharide deacetylase family protein n=1 Tax=Halorubrum ezzemoulense TaxID=337243 RepID=A0ABT4Z463_HALEZ|nr:polysaccharide deacetylase family protein [Halorubrum ezzemoulense]MDB2245709.1 polysaccharide deacetylase family protein [Halorubrum ezzemoulense]MDB2279356.1 polysaccharide deacetylase family protein [Halorubrum ezzemoulense]MDB2289874.1 polysaccharide deacetylase family protein [Halorubrum ezzemoulense]MDB2292958.1 polysaccharide deacetylase family protein [Halorubrum ezzemoulense]MDB2297344.1 polysaccharide deacetylase family protein [Halorubrum ezzemoulense]
MSDDTGVFTISLDTELAWGMFDKGNVEQYEAAYRNTPQVIDRLCELFDEYEIPATWAIVSHLLEDCDGDHSDRAAPDFEWVDDWFGALPCVRGMDEGLWYAPWLIDRIQDCETEQEIGLHGSTHMQLGADGCLRQHAEEEIGAAVETLRSHGVEPKSFVFPRNDVGHLDVLREHGIEVYRGVDARWYERAPVPSAVKPPLRFADETVRGTPPVVEPMDRDGIIEIPGSQVFRPSHDGWQHTPGKSSVARAKKGLRRAARTGGVFHLWFHPFNLGHEPDRDLARLEAVLTVAAELSEAGEIVCRQLTNVVSRKRYGQ